MLTPLNIPTESQEHLTLMKWINTQPLIRDVIIHIPNEGKREVIFGSRLKRMGMRAGVSDFFLPIPTHKYHGLWLELKRLKGSRETEQQKSWLNKMLSLDYYACFAYGWVEAREIILQYLSDRPERPKAA